MSVRDEKIAELLVHLAADFIAREAGRDTLITPTRAELGKGAKTARVYVSVFPYEHMPHALDFLARRRNDIRTYLTQHGRFSVLPHVTFVADEGERNRQHLDDLSRKLDSR